MIRQFRHRLKRDQRGATVVEFAVVLMPLCILLMGLGDLGYQTYLNAVTRGVLEKAAREASVGALSASQFDSYVAQQMDAVDTKYGSTSTVKRSYYQFSRVGRPEKITTDTAPLGSYNAGDCYEDANNNGSFDSSSTSGNANLGGADDVVRYEVTVSVPRLFPMAKLLGWSNIQQSSAKVVLRNQPWANQEKPVIRC